MDLIISSGYPVLEASEPIVRRKPDRPVTARPVTRQTAATQRRRSVPFNSSGGFRRYYMESRSSGRGEFVEPG